MSSLADGHGYGYSYLVVQPQNRSQHSSCHGANRGVSSDDAQHSSEPLEFQFQHDTTK